MLVRSGPPHEFKPVFPHPQFVPAPGSTKGPCHPRICVHYDCAEMRATAAARCCACEKAIGYDEPYQLDERTFQVIHEACLIDTAGAQLGAA